MGSVFQKEVLLMFKFFLGYVCGLLTIVVITVAIVRTALRAFQEDDLGP